MTLDGTKLDAALWGLCRRQPPLRDRHRRRRHRTDETIADTVTSLTATNGLISTRQTALSAQSKQISKSIDDKRNESTTTKPASKQFADLDQAMSI